MCDISVANNAPQAVIIEPSRELAEQTSNQIKLFKKYIENPSIRDLLVIGGVNVKEQISVLQNKGNFFFWCIKRSFIKIMLQELI